MSSLSVSSPPQQEPSTVRSASSWWVSSFTGDKRYLVTKIESGYQCSCPDYAYRQHRCKHIKAVTLEEEASTNRLAQLRLFELLLAEGYRDGAPSIDTARIDRAACLESHCGACGHLGLSYYPFIREKPYSYRAVSVCPACNLAEEF